MSYTKGEPSSHLLCDQLVQSCEGLLFKVIGADGEKSIPRSEGENGQATADSPEGARRAICENCDSGGEFGARN